jgi:chromosome segregation ATPase
VAALYPVTMVYQKSGDPFLSSLTALKEIIRTKNVAIAVTGETLPTTANAGGEPVERYQEIDANKILILEATIAELQSKVTAAEEATCIERSQRTHAEELVEDLTAQIAALRRDLEKCVLSTLNKSAEIEETVERERLQSMSTEHLVEELRFASTVLLEEEKEKSMLQSKLKDAEKTAEKERVQRLNAEKLVKELRESSKNLFRDDNATPSKLPLLSEIDRLNREQEHLRNRQEEEDKKNWNEMNKLHEEHQRATSQRDSVQAKLEGEQARAEALQRELDTARRELELFRRVHSQDVLPFATSLATQTEGVVEEIRTSPRSTESQREEEDGDGPDGEKVDESSSTTSLRNRRSIAEHKEDWGDEREAADDGSSSDAATESVNSVEEQQSTVQFGMILTTTVRKRTKVNDGVVDSEKKRQRQDPGEP